MNAITAVDKNWGIGYNGELLFNIPEDKKFFRNMTIGKTVIMGRKTFESLPNGKALQNRKNIVFTRNADYSADNVVICHSVAELKKAVDGIDTNDVFIIGGAEIYKIMLSFCSVIYVTKIDAEKTADCFFPNIDKMYEWKLTDCSEIKEYEGIKYKFCTYTDISHLI